MQLYFILFAMLLRTALPYSSGAPDGACGDMIPRHLVDPQTSTPPYSISAANTTIAQGEKLLIMIESVSIPFKGFFIQAHDSSNNPIGVFLTPVYNTFTCGKGFNNAITHGSSSTKDKITLQWQPPQNFDGNIKFKATIVQTKNVFWTNLNSKIVSVVKRSVGSVPESHEEPVTIPPLPVSQGLEKLIRDVYNDCGTSKSCFGAPAECVVKKNCKILTTFTKVREEYEFELLGKILNNGRQFLAIGFSDDALMGEDAVILCTSDGKSMDIHNAWNYGKDNKNVVDRYKGITPISTGFSDDNMYCSFRRIAQTIVDKREIYLDSKTFHVLVATGVMNSAGIIQYHGGQNRLATDKPVALGRTSKLNSSDDRLLKIIHACLMITAWVSAASCGILFARYYKKTWLGFKCRNIDMWFHMHRFFMMSTWCLTLAAFIIIVYNLRDFRVTKHSLVGVFSVGLCFIQPFIAALRCHPGTPNRHIFNWIHWFVGNSAQILGITAIFLGLELFLGSDRHWIKEVCWYILIVFIAFHILVHLMLSFSQCIGDSKVKKSENAFPMKDLTDSRMALQPEDSRPDAPMSCLRKFILGIYLPINWIATALLIILLVVKKEDLESTLSSWGVPSFWEDIE